MSLRTRLTVDYLERRDNPSIPVGDPYGDGYGPPPPADEPPPPPPGNGIGLISTTVGTPPPPPPGDYNPISGGSTDPYSYP